MSEGDSQDKKFVFVCLNEHCCKRGSERIHEELSSQCTGSENIEVREYICFGNCDYGVNTVIFPDRVWFSGLCHDGASVVLDYLRHGRLSDEYAGNVEEELAEATWELLELEIEDEEPEEQASDKQWRAGGSS